AVARGLSWVGIGHVVSQLCWYGSLLAVAALVSPREFGSVTIPIVLIQVAWLLVGSGARGSFVVAPRLTRQHVAYSVTINCAAGLAIGAGLAAAAGPAVDALAPGTDPALLRVLALTIGLYGLSVVPLALLQRELQFKRHAA